MKIRFMDGNKIDVLRIYGGPKLVNGIQRDVLRIEIDPNSITSDEIRSIFDNNPNTMVMYTYSESPTENGDTISEEVKIGEGYTMFISCDLEEITIPHTPGLLEPDTKQEIYVVMIAQMTYEEYQESKGE